MQITSPGLAAAGTRAAYDLLVAANRLPTVALAMFWMAVKSCRCIVFASHTDDCRSVVAIPRDQLHIETSSDPAPPSSSQGCSCLEIGRLRVESRVLSPSVRPWGIA
ncbi:hypothetical protein P152DRAFT_28669 [Eremomyces bilateralis CBS 781.70]|uniref:Uncharacterized protein n=1 Tax=Eremomyces bilateralis CBS 781.70 TaxID=1392243 RepID=A0A6G1G2R7_9PEZI|nr:uncharacterized protein P152DRAFT_28669 [Eremomyces bilateralis CBS 781.70]KAF1812221.1 hypothetical protein P152DRAFT_28669 [Eremomyces bilateralis CBS 781.70]